MNAQDFANFLTNKLDPILKNAENNALNLMNGDIKENLDKINRLAGARDILSQIVKGMDGMVNDFLAGKDPTA